MTRRDWLKLLLAAPIAATVDVEKLLWVPKPIVTVPAMPLRFHRHAFNMVWPPVERWEVLYGFGYLRDPKILEAQREYNRAQSILIERLVP